MDIKIIDEKIEECFRRLSLASIDTEKLPQNTDFNKGYWQGQLAAYMDVSGMLHEELRADNVAYAVDVIKMYFAARKDNELTLSDMPAMAVSVVTVEQHDPTGAVSNPLLGELNIQQARKVFVSDLAEAFKSKDKNVADVAQRCLDVLDKKNFPKWKERAR